MPVLADFSLARYEDGNLTITMAPATPIGGWSVQLRIYKHFGGGSGLVIKNMASGFINVSGINIINSGQGIFNVTLNSADTSGLAYGNYVYEAVRLDSGYRSVLAEGILSILPSIG